jgi:hypothetical protein
MKPMMRVVAILAAAMQSGCAWVADEISSDTTTAGPKPISVDFEEVHLPALLDPEGKAKANTPDWDLLSEGKRIDLAFHAFHSEYDTGTERERRDQVQERLLGISNQMCSRYLSYMQNIHSDGNFVLGSLATLAGAAGAIVTGGTSQILAGAAGALSGVRAEFNQDYFSNLTVAVITSGINLRRKEIYDEIVRYGTDRDEKRYPVEAAVKDALFYHGECSLMAGVEKAGDSIKLAQDPGLDAVNRTLFKVNQMRLIAQDQVTDPADVPGMGANTIKLLQAGKPTGDFIADGTDVLPNMVLGQLKLRVVRLVGRATDSAERIQVYTDAAQKKAIQEAFATGAKTIDGKIEICKAEAEKATNDIIAALGRQAAAVEPDVRKKEDRALEAALLQGNAVSAKMRIPVDIFTGAVTQVVAELEEIARKAKDDKARQIGADQVKSAQQRLATAIAASDTGCTAPK